MQVLYYIRFILIGVSSIVIRCRLLCVVDVLVGILLIRMNF